MSSNNWIDEAAKRIEEAVGTFHQEDRIAQIIREEYEKHTGSRLTFENTGVPGSFSDIQKMMDQQAAGRQARETGLGSQCLGPRINAHALGYGMNMPLPGRNLGDGQ